MKFLRSLSQFLVDFMEAGSVVSMHDGAAYCCTGRVGLCNRND